MSGNVTPPNYNLIINQAQTSFLNYLLGELQQYNYGKPNARVQFGVNETARQRLTPLIQPPVSLTIDVTGLAPYPGDFEQVDAMYTAAMDRIRFVPQHKLPAYITDPIDPVSTNPIYMLESTGFRFYPNTTSNAVSLSSALLSYVQTPPAIFWNSTPDSQGRPVYSVAGSTAPVWYNVDMFDIIARALSYIGVNLQAPEISRFAEMVDKEGQ